MRFYRTKKRGKRGEGVRKHKVITHKNKNKNHCSPHAMKNKIVSGSCFTKDAIQTITIAHNENNPSQRISETLSPREKWKKLKQKMSRIPNCEQDNCWLDRIPLKDHDKKLLKAQLFVPPKPREWDKFPNTWLTNFDIENVLNQYEKAYPTFRFIGPSPIDYDTRPNRSDCVCNNLCNFSVDENLKNGKTKIGIVFNLDPHNKSGSHWVAMFIDLEDKFLFYFNSTGENIQPLLKKFKNTVIEQGVKRLGKMDYHVNTYEHQRSNTECGMYCLYFIITCLLRETDILKEDSEQRMTTAELVQYFTKERIPDKVVEEYREELFL
jgi:hypothetical protein